MNRNPVIILLFLLLIQFQVSCKQAAAQETTFKAMFYNVENLFDYFDDSTKNDNEFLPQSDKYWTKQRFQTKLSRIAKVIVALGEMQPPDIVGMCEVENSYCLFQMCNNSILSPLDYKYIHYESPDKRGIDVALLYRPELFEPISSHPIRIHNTSEGSLYTRDILYVKAFSESLKDTIHVFVNHWPSRRGGKAQSENKRTTAASRLRTVVDSILTITPSSNILIMGDFNDEPHNKSIVDVLNVDINATDFTSQLFWIKDRFNPGTHKYQGHWAMLDNFFVSRHLKELDPKTQIAQFEFLLKDDPRYVGSKPFRTYQAVRYMDGYSDHLPILLTIEFKR